MNSMYLSLPLIFMACVSSKSSNEDPSGDAGSDDASANEDLDSDDAIDLDADEGSSEAESEYPVRETLPIDFVSMLTEFVACEEVSLYMYSADKTIGMTVSHHNIFNAISDDDALTWETTLPSNDVMVLLEVGGNLQWRWCDLGEDVREGPRQVAVSDQYFANTGTVEIRMDPATWDTATQHAAFALTNVDFGLDSGTVTMESPMMEIRPVETYEPDDDG